jgi:hypothetical protein
MPDGMRQRILLRGEQRYGEDDGAEHRARPQA